MTMRNHVNPLTEAASDIIFHTTSLKNAISILETQTLRLSDIREEEDGPLIQKTSPWVYYFSTSRSPANAFSTLSGDEGPDMGENYEKNSIHVTFKLSGRWFNQRGYKASPILWGYDSEEENDPEIQQKLEKYKYPYIDDEVMRILKSSGFTQSQIEDINNQLRLSYQPAQSYDHDSKPRKLKVGKEKEDRIFSRTPIIKLTGDCILECYVFIKRPIKKIRGKKTLESLRKLKSLSESLNIKIKFFDQFNHWLTPMKRPGVDDRSI